MTLLTKKETLKPEPGLSKEFWCTEDMCTEPRAGIFYVSPSGGGKNSIIEEMLKIRWRNLHPYCTGNLEFMPSGTTRKRRDNEMHGVNYYYFELEEFERYQKGGQFIESNENYPGVWYGSLWPELHRITSKGDIPITDIDVVGALNLKKKFGDRILVIFVDPCLSIPELLERIKSRGENTNPEDRMRRVEFELSFRDKFDAVIENRNGRFKEACKDSECLILEFLRKRFPLKKAE